MHNDEHSPTVQLAKQLIARSSITPNDAGCQELISQRLAAINFQINKLKFGDVENLWARHGTAEPTLVFAGHTDVVPPGPAELWTSDPFQPEIRQDKLYGRGAADMKGSLAAMLIAAENFVAKYPKHKGSIAFLITSDEEGQAIDGTVKVVDYLQKKSEKLQWCIVGEASSEENLGDIIKVGRRGSLNGKLTLHGKQGHIAYPQLADNPIHKIAAVIDELCHIQWDKGNKEFPPTSFQISNIYSGTGADNVIPGKLEMLFNFRFSTAVTPQKLQNQVHAILDKHRLDYHIDWRVSGNPFLTLQGELIDAARTAIYEVMQIEPKLSTAGGTSDGRFIATTGCQVIEIGPNNRSIHQVDEHVSIIELNKLTKIYERIIEQLLT